MARPVPPRPWFGSWDELAPNRGDGSVCLIARGAVTPEITALVKQVSGDLGIPLVVDDPHDIQSVLRASALILYNNKDANDGLSNFAVACAQGKNTPLIVLYEENVAFNAHPASIASHMVYDPAFGAITLDTPLMVPDRLHDALADLFSRIYLAQAKAARGWEWGVFAGLKQTANLGKQPAPTQIILLTEWIRRHDALVDEANEKMALAGDLVDYLVRSGGYTLPVPIEDIVVQHGIVIERKPLHNLSARLTRRDGIAVIEVNENEQPTRQRFSIAHEFGHYKMVHGDLCFRMGPAEPWAFLPNEEAADIFAADLLMPALLLDKAFDDVKDKAQRANNPRGELIRLIAEKCQVSVSAAEIRLQTLKLIS